MDGLIDLLPKCPQQSGMGSGQTLGSGTQSRSPMWAAGTQLLEPS